MRIAKTLSDLPVGTPIEIDGAYRLYKGIVTGAGHSSNYRQEWIRVLFADGSDIIYYEEDIETEGIMIVELIGCE